MDKKLSVGDVLVRMDENPGILKCAVGKDFDLRLIFGLSGASTCKRACVIKRLQDSKINVVLITIGVYMEAPGDGFDYVIEIYAVNGEIKDTLLVK